MSVRSVQRDLRRQLAGVLPMLLGVGLIATSALAAPWDKSNRLKHELVEYDKKQEMTLSGTVEKVFEKTPSTEPNPNSVGWHIWVKSESDLVDVHLGPIWWIKSLAGRIDPGDMIQILGSREEANEKLRQQGVTFRLVGIVVRKGGEEVLRLRDDQGRPLWAGF